MGIETDPPGGLFETLDSEDGERKQITKFSTGKSFRFAGKINPQKWYALKILAVRGSRQLEHPLNGDEVFVSSIQPEVTVRVYPKQPQSFEEAAETEFTGTMLAGEEVALAEGNTVHIVGAVNDRTTLNMLPAVAKGSLEELTPDYPV